MEESQPLLVYLANLWRVHSHTPPFPTAPRGVPTSSSSSSPPPIQNEKEGKKLLLFTPHLPPKLLNFIPRTNKSIFIAAGGAGSGLTVLPFLFFKVLLNLLGSAGTPPLPQHTSLLFFLLLPRSHLIGSCAQSQEAFQSPACLPGRSKSSASLLFVWHFIVFLTLPAHASRRAPDGEALPALFCEDRK